MTHMQEPDPAVAPEESIMDIGQTLTRMRVMMGRRIIGRLAIAQAAPGLDLSQLDILEVVRRLNQAGGEATVGGIAEAMRLDPSRGSRLVADLVGRGLLQRAVSQEDGRRSIIQVTEEGQGFAREIRVVKHRAIATVTSDWTEEERELFAALFSRFMDGFERIYMSGERVEEDGSTPSAIESSSRSSAADA